MTNPGTGDWERISALFSELVLLDSTERAHRLAEIEKEDPALKSTIQSLLAADAAADVELARFDFGLSNMVRRSPSASTEPGGDPLRIAGRTISHFQIVNFLASGGMGVVYRAKDLQLDRFVALKFPLPHYQLDQSIKDRFIREARSAGSLEHVNLCTVYEAGESEAGIFLAMPLYSGMTLKEKLAHENRLSLDQALDIVHQITAGLAYAHASGIIHRDLKPGNVMLLPDNTVKILDFGLAKATDISATKSGITLGTVSYMAPEQIRGRNVDARADLWSVGILLYEMLSGKRPFVGDSEASIANAIINVEPKDLGLLRTEIPRSLASLIRTLLQKDPRSRYQTAKELHADVSRLRRGESAEFHPALWLRAASWIDRRRVVAGLIIASLTTAALFIALPRLSSEINRPTRNDQAYQLYQRGREYERLGPMSAAESLYRRAIALDTGFALARARLAIVYAACQPGGSRDCSRRNITDRTADRTKEMRHEAEAALRRDPRLPDAHFAMGLYWEQRERPESALTEFTIARNGLDRDGDLHAAIGRAYRARGEWNLAIREFQRAIKIDPRDASSLSDLATTFSRLRRYDESVRSWNRYLELVPDAYEGMQIKGNVFLRWLGTVDSLEAIFRQLPAEKQKGSHTTHVLIARIRNKPAEALAALNEAPRQPAIGVNINTPVTLQKAQVYVDLRDSIRARINFDSARIELERSVAAKPGDFRGHMLLGLAYAGLGRYAEAIREANRATAIMPPSRTVPLGTTAMRGKAEIFSQIPEKRVEAVRILDQLMQMPAGREVSAAFLRVDPAWIPLKNTPEFQRLLAKYPVR